MEKQMFAVIKTGGKQYKVAVDDVITIEKLDGADGDTLEFGEVLMVGGDKGLTLGAPFVDGASVSGEIVAQKRGEKVINFKKRRRKHSSKRRIGHRQHLTDVKITAIAGA